MILFGKYLKHSPFKIAPRVFWDLKQKPMFVTFFNTEPHWFALELNLWAASHFLIQSQVNATPKEQQMLTELLHSNEMWRKYTSQSSRNNKIM